MSLIFFVSLPFSFIFVPGRTWITTSKRVSIQNMMEISLAAKKLSLVSAEYYKRKDWNKNGGSSSTFRIGILNKEGNCKRKTRPGILRPEKARNSCTRQLHRIVLVICTRLAVYCYSKHHHGFSAGNLYFCINLLIDQVM